MTQQPQPSPHHFRSSPSLDQGAPPEDPLPSCAIVFVGPMAAGKTTLGWRVAKQLDIPFVDSDAEFQRQYGDIASFFDTQGEAEFRRLEQTIIAEELARPVPRIVSLGGGAVLAKETRLLLRKHLVVLLLTTQEAVLRTMNLAQRPLLRDQPEAWDRIFAERSPLYEEVAHVSFRTDRGTVEELTRRLTQWIISRGRYEAQTSARSSDQHTQARK